jgi:flagellar FliL protein
MAEQEDIEVVDEKKGNSKLLIIIIAVLLLAVIGLAVMMFMGGGDKPADSEDAAEATETVKQNPIYFTVEAPFIVNFKDQSNGAVRYLQIKVKVMARSQAVIDSFTLHEPAIKHELLLLFYSQNYDDLNSVEGTKALRKLALEKVNEIISEDVPDTQLENVYFTSLIMQ